MQRLRASLAQRAASTLPARAVIACGAADGCLHSGADLNVPKTEPLKARLETSYPLGGQFARDLCRLRSFPATRSIHRRIRKRLREYRNVTYLGGFEIRRRSPVELVDQL